MKGGPATNAARRGRHAWFAEDRPAAAERGDIGNGEDDSPPAAQPRLVTLRLVYCTSDGCSPR